MLPFAKAKSSWLPVWLGFLPIFSAVSVLAFGFLGRWSTLPRSWQFLLYGFIATQLLAALFTPQPLLSLALAGLRAVFTLSLLLAGTALGSSQALRPTLAGYSVVALTAFATTLKLHPHALLSERLVHPYYTMVSLGLAGAIGLLLALTWRGGALWARLLGGGLCLGMFLWSGSRGPLIALVAGLLAALLVNLRGQWRSTLGGLVLAGAAILAIQSRLPGNILGRFFENTLNGRGQYWADALATAQAHPWGGTGPYQLGPYLSTQFGEQSCQLWLKWGDYGLKQCPAVLEQVRGAWLIAHNTAFHLLGETGIIGTTGWFGLMAALALAAWRSRDPLLNALTWATAAMGLVDNPTLLPSLGSAELYWLAGGVALAQVSHAPAQDALADTSLPALAPRLAPLLACVMLGYFTLPLWAGKLNARQVPLPTLEALSVPQVVAANESVTLFMKIKLPAEAGYTLHGQLCQQQKCLNLFRTQLKEAGWLALGFKAPLPGTYQLRLTLQNNTPHLGIDYPAARLERKIDVQ